MPQHSPPRYPSQMGSLTDEVHDSHPRGNLAISRQSLLKIPVTGLYCSSHRSRLVTRRNNGVLIDWRLLGSTMVTGTMMPIHSNNSSVKRASFSSTPFSIISFKLNKPFLSLCCSLTLQRHFQTACCSLEISGNGITSRSSSVKASFSRAKGEGNSNSAIGRWSIRPSKPFTCCRNAACFVYTCPNNLAGGVLSRKSLIVCTY